MKAWSFPEVEPDTFERVFCTYSQPLHLKAVSILNDHNIAEDVVQTVFIRLLRYWRDAFEPSPQMKSWLFPSYLDGSTGYREVGKDPPRGV